MSKIIGIILLCLASVVQAAPAANPQGSVLAPGLNVVQGTGNYVEGKDYKVLPQSAAAGPTAKALLDSHPGKIEVIDFFSYGCPVCYRIQPDFNAWAHSKEQGQQIVIVDVPVNWEHPGWENLARSFYIAEALNILPKMHSAMFEAIHTQGKNFKNQADLEEYFLANGGVSRDEFQKTFDSFTVRRRMKQGELLQQEYNIMAIPAFVVNGKYYVDVQTAGGMKQAIAVLDYLVNKESFTKGADKVDFGNVPAASTPGTVPPPKETMKPSTAPQ